MWLRDGSPLSHCYLEQVYFLRIVVPKKILDFFESLDIIVVSDIQMADQA